MLTGGCQCGAVRYECTGEPTALFVCYCRECQHQSGSAFGMSLIMPPGIMRVIKGTPKFWTRRADSGSYIRSAFCPDCGSRLWDEPEPGDCIVIKAGSLDAPVDISRAIHIWTSRKLPGTVIPPGAQQFAGEPE